MLLAFDLDGTLVRLPIEWRVIEFNIEKISRGRTRSFLGFLARFYNTKEFWEIHQLVERLELEALEKLEVLDNADTVVRYASEYFEIAIVTMQSRYACKSILRKLGLESLVKYIVARDDAGTRVNQLRQLLSIASKTPRETIFVGDKILDAFSALILGINPILVLRTVSNPWFTPSDNILEDLEAMQIPVVNSLREALDLALRLSRQQGVEGER